MTRSVDLINSDPGRQLIRSTPSGGALTLEAIEAFEAARRLIARTKWSFEDWTEVIGRAVTLAQEIADRRGCTLKRVLKEQDIDLSPSTVSRLMSVMEKLDQVLTWREG